MENEMKVAENQPALVSTIVDKAEITRFYKQDFPDLVKKIFIQPYDGTCSLFVNRSDKSYFHSMILIASAALSCTFFIYFSIPAAIHEYTSWFSLMSRSALSAVILLLLISACSFGIKMISGKPNFRNELLTGGLCAIPLIALMLVLFIGSKVVLDEESLDSLLFGGFGAVVQKGGLMLLMVFYLVLLFINILQQSLRAAGTKDVLLWYLSPLSILLSFYLTIKIVI